VFQQLVNKANLGDMIEVDSAGTSGYHAGHLPDARMREHAKRRGYDLTSRSRKLLEEDLAEFDLILCMDDSNLTNSRSLDRKLQYQDKIKKLTDYCKNVKADHVPDPYYGGEAGFEFVMDIIEDACANLLAEVSSRVEKS
jgi:protein-tyrosine phosphatase